jgi:hypothetical protein
VSAAARPAVRRLATACFAALCLGALTAPGAGARELTIPTFLSPGRNSDVSPSIGPGARPYELFNTFTFNQAPVVGAPIGPAENVRDLTFEFPPGLVAGAVRYPRCSAEAFAARACATVSQVGVAELALSAGAPQATVPVFNVSPSPGNAAQFAFHAPYADAHLDFQIRNGTDYGATATLRSISSSAGLISAALRIWGVPGDPAHDAERFSGAGLPMPGPYPEAPPYRPLLSNPTACNGPLITTMQARTWQNPGRPVFAAPFEAPGTGGCDQLDFSPTVEVKPSTNLADSPSGLDLHLHVPQISDSEGSASAQLRGARIDLPAGLAINPAAANGLGTCTPSDIGLLGVSSERQLLRYDLPPVNFSGSFTVAREGAVTAPISATASSGQVAAALETLPGLAGNVTVGGAAGGWVVEFTGALVGTDVSLLTGQVTDNPSRTLAITAQGGTYTLSSGGQSTAPLPFDATATEVQAALRGIPSLGLGNLYPGNVFVNGGTLEGDTRSFQVVFAGDLNGTTPPLTATPSLTGPEAGVAITPVDPPPPHSLSVVSFGGNSPGTPQFTPAPPGCPENSKVGIVRVDSPALLDHPLSGSVYLATPGRNPFGSLFAIYLTVSDPVSGIQVKLPARIDSDPATGELHATLTEAPQLPFEDLRVELFRGSAAPLRTPITCGTFQADTVLTPWSAPEGAIRRPKDTFAIGLGAGAGACAGNLASVPDATRFSVGTLDPSAGISTPFLLKLTRPNGSRTLGDIDTTLPEGLLARIAGIPACPESVLAATATRSAAAESAAPSCPAASRVGSLGVLAGAGPAPYALSGNAYLAGPYRGAPLSLALITPALAGPFDLGTVLVRVALRLDSRTTRVRAISDPFPAALGGVPIDLRSVALRLDPGFARNPTSCYPLEFTGANRSQSAHFQVGDCRRLAFAPKLAIALKGSSARGSHPALSATLTNPGKGTEANLAAAELLLPKALRIDRSRLRAPGSVYGQATATTPLLSEPLRGPLRLGRTTAKSAQLLVELHGAFDVNVEGSLQVAKNGAVRVSFSEPPDVPLTRFTLAMDGAKKGLLQAAANLCARPLRVGTELTGQNAATQDSKAALKVPCGKGGKAVKRDRGRRGR